MGNIGNDDHQEAGDEESDHVVPVGNDQTSAQEKSSHGQGHYSNETDESLNFGLKSLFPGENGGKYLEFALDFSLAGG